MNIFKKIDILKIFKVIVLHKYKNTYKMYQKYKNEFYCECCDYKTSVKCNFDKHLLTAKHIKLINTYKKEEKKYGCKCGKFYKHNQSLYNHKKTCKFNDKNDKTEILIKKIEELEETIKNNPTNQIINNNTNNNTNNNINNQFNLNIFLNEKCKDAINILEFKNMVKEAIEDISNVMNLQLTDAITNVINIKYNEIDDYKKPFYTTDKSRKKIAIKDENNEWIKEDNNIIYNNMKNLQNAYLKNQFDNFYKNIKDKENMREKEQDDFIKVVKNTTGDLDKDLLIKNILNNSINPKCIKK